MSLTVTKIETYAPEVVPCVCGSRKISHTAYENGYGGGDGYAYVKCDVCGLTMDKRSYNIGHGESLIGIYGEVVRKWNISMQNARVEVKKEPVFSLKGASESLLTAIRNVVSGSVRRTEDWLQMREQRRLISAQYDCVIQEEDFRTLSEAANLLNEAE